MAQDYTELLDPDSLAMLAETTGIASRANAGKYFSEQPYGLRVALGSAEAAKLIASPRDHSWMNQRLLVAIAVTRTAEEICSAGWMAADESPVDLDLLNFAGQVRFQTFMIDLMAARLSVKAQPGLPELESSFDSGSVDPTACAADRLVELIELANSVSETERAGVIRLLGDEALFVASVSPSEASQTRLTPDHLALLETVLPRAVRSVLDDLAPKLRTLLDAYLMFGAIWFTMASQNLLHRPMRLTLTEMGREFDVARRFLVRVSQGHLAAHAEHLFAECAASAPRGR